MGSTRDAANDGDVRSLLIEWIRTNGSDRMDQDATVSVVGMRVRVRGRARGRRRRIVMMMIAGLALLSTSCLGSGGRKYDASVRSNFVRSCEANGGTSIWCMDVLECLESKWSQERFAREDRRMLLGRPSDEAVDILADCTG